MAIQPIEGKDIEVKIVAFLDNTDVASIRTEGSPMTPVSEDLVLFRAEKDLGLKQHPIPRRHNPSTFSSTTEHQETETIGLLGYNGYPSTNQIRKLYPEVSFPVLINAVKDLWIDRLSYGTGPAISNHDLHTISHRISCYSGISGGAVVDRKGHLLGQILHAF